MQDDGREVFEHNGYKVSIIPDFNPESPIERGDTECFIVTTRNRYFQVEGPNGETADTIGENLKEWEETHHVYKLNALIHSGVRLSITSNLKEYYMGFDSGQIGFVVIKKEETPDPFKYAQGVVEEWNQYLSGDVWGYTIEDGEENDYDSCWGFYGFEYAKQEAIDNVPKEAPEVTYDEDEEA